MKPKGFTGIALLQSAAVDLEASESGCFQKLRESMKEQEYEFNYDTYGGFLKWWVYPTTMAFPTKNDHFGEFWGYHHLRKHPYEPDYFYDYYDYDYVCCYSCELYYCILWLFWSPNYIYLLSLSHIYLFIYVCVFTYFYNNNNNNNNVFNLSI